MAFNLIENLVVSLLNISPRLQSVATGYLLALMLEAAKNTQSFASSITNKAQSQFSRFLNQHKALAIASLDLLAKQFALSQAPLRHPIIPGVTWTIALLIDATLHPRSSRHLQNSQRFNHGQGFVIGHQWTNVVLYINNQVIPLPPIPFYSKNECKRRKIAYKTEHERILEFFQNFDLTEYVGEYFADEVVVLTDSGYDDKVLQAAILAKGWDFVSSLKANRGAKSLHAHAAGKKKWPRVDDLFWATRKTSPWKTVVVPTDGGKKRRKFRARKLVGRIKGIAQDVALVCSEKSGKTKGRRFFVCSVSGLDQGTIIRLYSKRWAIELFHRTTKQQLGMLDAGVRRFDAQVSHVHWAYCAYILLHQLEIEGATTLLEKQRRLTKMVAKAPWQGKLRSIDLARNQFGGRQRQDQLVTAALREAMAA